MLAVGNPLPTGILPLLATWTAGGVTYLLLLQFVLLPGYLGRILALLCNAMTPRRRIPREEAT